MGLGDDLMFLGECEKIYKEYGEKIFPMMHKRPLPPHKWSPMYDNVDFITDDPAEAGFSMNIKPTKKGKQLYIDDDTAECQTYLQYEPVPFALKLTKEEQKIIEDLRLELGHFVIVNPDYKGDVFGENKNWGAEKWQELINKLSHNFHVVRLITDDRKFENCTELKINDVRIAFGLTQFAEFVVSSEGGLVHAASGFGTKCVVLFNGLTPPWAFGYENNINITFDHEETPCGRKYNCEHCREGWEQLTVDFVYEKCNDLFLS